MTKETPPDAAWNRTPLVEVEEIFGSLGDRRGTSLFLGRFTLAEIAAVLEKRSLTREARKRGLWPLVVDLDASEFPRQRLRIFVAANAPDRLIVDLKIRECVFDPGGRNFGRASPPVFPALSFEWLTLQNPLAGFSETRGRLPGQDHPGLGMSKRIIDLFTYLGKVTRKSGLLAFPAFYHNAVLFSRFFRFLNPVKEAEVRAIHRAFSRVSIKQMAWIVHLGCLRTASGEVYEWTAEEQVLPLRREVKAYFDGRPYREAVKEAAGRFRFAVDWDAFERKFQRD
jgi:hypothetical protein